MPNHERAEDFIQYVTNETSLTFHKPYNLHRPASWSSGNAFVSGAGGLRLESRAGQIDLMLPTACHRYDVPSKRAVLPGRNDAEMSPANLSHASA